MYITAICMSGLATQWPLKGTHALCGLCGMEVWKLIWSYLRYGEARRNNLNFVQSCKLYTCEQNRHDQKYHFCYFVYLVSRHDVIMLIYIKFWIELTPFSLRAYARYLWESKARDWVLS